jgi:hypothetical protein
MQETILSKMDMDGNLIRYLKEIIIVLNIVIASMQNTLSTGIHTYLKHPNYQRKSIIISSTEMIIDSSYIIHLFRTIKLFWTDCLSNFYKKYKAINFMRDSLFENKNN